MNYGPGSVPLARGILWGWGRAEGVRQSPPSLPHPAHLPGRGPGGYAQLGACMWAWPGHLSRPALLGSGVWPWEGGWTWPLCPSGLPPPHP